MDKRGKLELGYEGFGFNFQMDYFWKVLIRENDNFGKLFCFGQGISVYEENGNIFVSVYRDFFFYFMGVFDLVFYFLVLFCEFI